MNMLIDTQAGTVTALAVWFDVEFSSRFCATPTVLSTAPGSPRTHWEQLVLPLKEAVQVAAGDVLRCRLSMARGQQHRTLDIAAELAGQVMSFQMGVDDEE